MAKVIESDNCDREHISDILIEGNLTDEVANAMADRLNDERAHGEDSIVWFRAVPDDHILYKAPDNYF